MASNKRFLATGKDYLVVFLAVVFLAGVAFLAGLAVALAILTRADLRREAVFFLMRPFLVALSYSL